jgi:NAD(P)-dependent dehydrogenase (short-subunit alcohol dehydrogenase family)
MDGFINFHNQSVVVTGGAAGIGAVSAGLFAKYGASVAIVDMDPNGERIAEDIRRTGGDATAHVVDLTDWSETKECMARIHAKRGRLDAVAHVAGGFVRQVSLVDCAVEDWDGVVRANLTPMFHILKAAAPYMIAARYGRIVSFSSMAARSAVNPNPPHYTAAKAGVLGLTRQVAGELGPFGITINAIAPANVRTPRANATRSDHYVEHISKVTPLRRLCEPEEVAAAVLFLCSKEAGYITGVTLDVNGGATMI